MGNRRAYRSWKTLLAAAMLTAGLTGCGDTYRMSFEMPAHSVATVRGTGDAPFLRVENDGPGAITITDPWGEPGTLILGARGRTLHEEETVRIETGDEPAQIRIILERATGMALDGPLPKDVPTSE